MLPRQRQQLNGLIFRRLNSGRLKIWSFEEQHLVLRGQRPDSFSNCVSSAGSDSILLNAACGSQENTPGFTEFVAHLRKAIGDAGARLEIWRRSTVSRELGLQFGSCWTNRERFRSWSAPWSGS